MKDMELDKELCLKFCQFYKPTKNRELACKGFLVIERLIEDGKKIPFDDFDIPAQADQMIDAVTEEMLIQNICITCPFYEGDCDFILHKGKYRPCGGFTLLGHLLEADVIVIEDIRRNNGKIFSK